MPFKQVSMLVALALLAFALLLSAVVAKYYERKSFVLSEKLAEEKDELSVHWESLQLERSVLRAEGRVEHIARTRLDMHIPGHGEIVEVGGG